MLRLAVKARLAHGRTCILDGTWPTDADRKVWAQMAQEHGVPFRVLILDTPAQTCVESDAAREVRVGRRIIEDIASHFQRASVYPQGEAWDVVTDIHGLYEEFLALLGPAGWQLVHGRLWHPPGRRLLVLGDTVDRGPRLRDVLRLLWHAVRDGVAVYLMGNHERKLLRFYGAYHARELSKWSSRANAETGMALIADREAAELAGFSAPL